MDTSVCLLNYKADGTPFYNQIYVAPLRDAEMRIINYVGVQVEVKVVCHYYFERLVISLNRTNILSIDWT